VKRARFVAPAHEEFLADVAWYDQVQPDQGVRFAAAVEEATARALAFPLSGSTATPTIRGVIIKNFPFSIVYRPEADGVNGGAWRAVKRSPVSNARRAQKPASP
jgi:hypothetical protein